ncbi:hypothetical protein [Treponema brennaborense]|uniref:hypothetical protein n=1 Tax=Treponema brennaborense TaxID=81028 RepID=UPI00030B29F5|nr:hypothetical protein [Treponema brennaborense]
MIRYAVLAGTSSKAGFQQKSICSIYDFLKSTAGGAWADREILILPEGVDVPLLKFILRRAAECGTDFLFLYFCGNEHDGLTGDGFSVGGTEIKRSYIEETCKKQVTVFDTCAALVPADDDGADDDGAEIWNADDGATACCADTGDGADERQLAMARILGDEALCAVDGGLWLSGCTEGERPVLRVDGCGVYTAALVESLAAADSMLDFRTADRSARFACAVARAAAEAQREAAIARGSATDTEKAASADGCQTAHSKAANVCAAEYANTRGRMDCR